MPKAARAKRMEPTMIPVFCPADRTAAGAGVEVCVAVDVEVAVDVTGEAEVGVAVEEA
jgi:hypothetical protein